MTREEFDRVEVARVLAAKLLLDSIASLVFDANSNQACSVQLACVVEEFGMQIERGYIACEEVIEVLATAASKWEIEMPTVASMVHESMRNARASLDDRQIGPGGSQ
jgi:hypothetical protein